MPINRRNLCSPLWAIVVCLSVTDAARGQDAVDPQSRVSVFLETDSTAIKKLGSARDALSARNLTPREWSDAVESLRQIAEQHKDKLVAIEPGRYVSVQSYCDILLAGLPAEGLKIYRSRVDPLAKQWFDAGKSSRNEELLLKVVHQAAISSYGDDALLLLGELAWEKGELSRARSYWQQLLPLSGRGEPPPLGLVLAYPDSNLDPALIRARLVLCRLMQGNLARAERELESFKEHYSQTRGTIAGRTGNLSQILGEIAAETAQTQLPSEDPGISTFAFNPQRNKILPEPVDVGKSQWSALLRDDDLQTAEGLLDHLRQPPGFQRPASYFPVVFNDIVLVCDETSVYAYKLRTGEPAWPADELTAEQRQAETAVERRKRARIYTLPPEKTQGSSSSNGAMAGVPRFTLTVEQGRLYVRLGSATSVRSGIVRNRSAASFLVCLDLARDQGRELWMIDADQVELGRENWSFEGSPLVAEGRLYVALRRNTAQPQANVACYDAETGKLIWNRKVCVGMSTLGVEDHEISHQLLTLGEDRLYYNTNLGAIAALELLDGSLRWAVTYARTDVETVSSFNKRQRHGPNPCLYHEGVLYAAPTDSNRVFAYDADTGLPKWGKPEVELRGQARALLGVAKGRLIVGGDQVWALDRETGRVDWNFDDGLDHPGYGRGLLAGDLLYWPTRDKVFILDQATGKPVRDPVNLKEKGAGGGNLAISGGFLLVARDEWLVAFSEYGGVKQRRQDEIIRRPNAAGPQYELALAEEAAGEEAQALAHYRRALKLARPEERRDSLPLRGLALDRLYGLLEKLGRAAVAKKEFVAAAGYYAEAAEAAPTLRQRTDSLLALGTAQAQGLAPKDAAVTYQTILDDSELASQRIDDEAARNLPVDVVVQRRLAGLIAQQGRGVYARFDDAAEAAFAEGFRRGDTQQIHMTVRRYPNALTTESAALRLAELQRTLKQYAAAATTCKRLLSRGSSAATRQAALTELARLAELQQFWRPAAGYWRQVAREFPKARISEQGREWTATEFVSQHLALDVFREQDQLASAGPGLELPLRRRWNHPGTAQMQTFIPEGMPPSAALGCVLLLHENLACLNHDAGTVRWQAAIDGPLTWAGYAGNVLVFATPWNITAVMLETGRTIWELELPLPEQLVASRFIGTLRRPQDSFISATADGALAVPRFVGELRGAQPILFALAPDGELLYCLQPGQQVCAIDSEDGTVVWRYRPRFATLQGYWHCGADRVAVQSRESARIVVLDRRDGSVQADSTQPDPSTETTLKTASLWTAHPLALSNGNLALIGTEQRVQLFDPSAGKMRWTYSGPMSQAHSTPDLVTNGTALLMVSDGTTLVRLDTETGLPLWSRSVGPEILTDARGAIVLDDQQAYVPLAGVLRCFTLKTGDLAWEQYLGTRDVPWRVVKTGRYVAAYPLTANGQFPVVVCEATTGEYVQKLNFAGPARSVQLHAGAKVAILDSGAGIFGLGR